MTAPPKHIRTSTLDIAYEEMGDARGVPVFLMHGWPYDPRCYDGVVPPLVRAGCRVIVPYLRGFGPTRFLSADTLRSGQQAALGHDLREMMDALSIERAFLAGFDWGGRAACIVAALWPERVRALVTVNAYNIQNIAAAVAPAPPAQEHRYWYQYYFNTERGRAGLPPIAARSPSCFGRCGRRIGASTMRRSSKARRPSTIRISSTLPSIPTGIATAMCRAIRRSNRSRKNSRASRGSRRRPSRSRAKPTASIRPIPPRHTMPASPDLTNGGFFQASGIIHRRKRRNFSPPRCSNC